MVEQTSEEELQQLTETFGVFDKNGDKTIEASELYTALHAVGILVTKAEVDEMIKEKDIDKNGKIEFNEFVQIVQKTQKPQEEIEESIKDAFQMFDVNGDGSIDKGELMRILTQIGQEKANPQDVEDMFKSADLDNDGKISISEFAKVIAGKS